MCSSVSLLTLFLPLSILFLQYHLYSITTGYLFFSPLMWSYANCPLSPSDGRANGSLLALAMGVNDSPPVACMGRKRRVEGVGRRTGIHVNLMAQIALGDQSLKGNWQHFSNMKSYSNLFIHTHRDNMTLVKNILWQVSTYSWSQKCTYTLAKYI